MRWKTAGKVVGLAIPFVLVGIPLGVDGCYSSRMERAVKTYQGRGVPMEPEDFRKEPVLPAENGGEPLLALVGPYEALGKEDEKKLDTLLDGYVLTREELEAARGILKGVMPAEKELEEILARPKVRWPGELFAMTPGSRSHYNKLRALANLLRADARVAMEEGDSGRAIRRAGQILQLGEKAAHDTVMIGLLVSVGIQAVAMNVLERGPEQVTREQATPLIAMLLDDAKWDAGVKEAMDGERGFLLANARASVAAMSPVKRPFGRIVGFRELPMSFKMADLATEGMLAKTAGERAAEQAKATTAATAKGALFTAITWPSYVRATEIVTRVRTERELSAVMLALRVYKMEKGTLPATLGELVPEYLPAVPMDPFDGAGSPLRYAAEKGLVYSVNANGSDDGGDVTPTMRGRSLDEWAAKDYGKAVVAVKPTTRPVEEP